MKFNYVNGWKNPRLTVYDRYNNFVGNYTFNELNGEGMVESHEEVVIQREDLNKQMKEYFLGYRLHFTLYYNQFINLDTLFKFKTVVDYQRSKSELSPFKIYLTPNEDNLARRFEVLFANENIELGLIKTDFRAYGNKGVILKLQTVNLEKAYPLFDPANIPYFNFSSYHNKQ
ncbi:MAG: hypothetical protein JST55_14500 [Bacteroidetes bacterium]|nr:hypothetical protein [Bacteroidota bacterium]